MTRHMLLAVATAALLPHIGTVGAATTVGWADFGANDAGVFDSKIVGAPDGLLSVNPWNAAKFDNLVSYPALAATMGLSEADLGTYDVLAWEANGGSPAASGGWESARWDFSAAGASVSTVFNELTGTGSTPGVDFKTGSITAAQYASLFGASRANSTVWSWLLVRLPGAVNADDASFLVHFAGVGGGVGLGEGTPDPDAIGVIHAIPEPGTVVLVCAGLAGLAGRRYWRRAR